MMISLVANTTSAELKTLVDYKLSSKDNINCQKMRHNISSNGTLEPEEGPLCETKLIEYLWSRIHRSETVRASTYSCEISAPYLAQMGHILLHNLTPQGTFKIGLKS